jgi:hypothetical protein
MVTKTIFEEAGMKKFFALFVSLVLLISLAVSPVIGGGGKNQGDVGQGSVDQGDTADAPGSDAQGNQV